LCDARPPHLSSRSRPGRERCRCRLHIGGLPGTHADRQQRTRVPAAGTSITIGTGTSPALGTYLTGAGGMTLYVRTSDPAGGSSCTGGCATAWPPLTVAAGTQALAGTGVSGALGTFARTDGSLQVTYNGHALYYYAADTKSGDTTGQGVGGIWFVAPVTGTGGAAPSPSATGSYGY
jgi:predicted lipoprotein with Yx(FWY)xxD motif